MATISNTSFAAANEIQISKGSRLAALISLAVLYFMLGFITCLNDTLVPFFKEGFTLTYTESSLVQFYFFLVYGIFSFPIGRVVEKIGYVKGMIWGFLFAAAGSLLFVPAASFHKYYLFLAALFIVAIGIVFMQVAANPFIILLGSARTASARLNLIQSVGSVGTIVAPLFGASVILNRISAGTSEAVKVPYTGIAIVLIILSILIYRLRLPDMAAKTVQAPEAGIKEGKQTIFSFRNLNFGALGIFFMVGIEVAIASFLTNYIADVLHIANDAANRYVAFYWGGMLIGRLVGVVLLRSIRPATLLIVNSVIAMSLILVSINSSGNTAVWSLIAVGLFNSVLFGIIFSLSVRGVGKHVTRASGLLSTAISGGGVVVVIQGLLIDSSSWSTAFILPLVCYLYIIFYGVNGHKSIYSRE